MQNEQMTEVVEIIGSIEKKLQRMVEKNKNLRDRVDDSIVKTKNFMDYESEETKIIPIKISCHAL